VVAPFFQLNYSLAVVALLPALFLGHLLQTIRLLVLWTLALGVELFIAQHAHLRRTCPTASIFPPIRHVHANFGRLDPLTASSRRAVQPVCRSVFLILLVPQDLELVVEQAIGVFERNVLRRAASWGHVRSILHGEGKLALETRVAHAVAAREFDCFVDRELVVHADETVDPREVRLQTVQGMRSTDIGTCCLLAVRELGLEKRLEKIPPVLLRFSSFVVGVLVSAGDNMGDLRLVWRVDGLLDLRPLSGSRSRADLLLRAVSVRRLVTWQQTHLLSFGTSSRCNEAEPEIGV
jgi:hypothetical protein